MADPSVVFVGHGAERTGPPVFLGHLQGWLDRHTDASVHTVLARGGPLVAAYERHGPVLVLDTRWTAPRVAAAGLGRIGVGGPADRLTATRHRVRLRSLPESDLVYVNAATPGGVRALRSIPWTPRRIVTHVHELSIGLDYHLSADDRAWLFDRTDQFIAASGAVVDTLVTDHGIAADQVALHYEFIDTTAAADDHRSARLRAELGIPDGAPVVGASGMTDWRKAPDLFLRLAWEVSERSRDLDVHWVWVGGDDHGPNWWPLDHDRRALGLEGRVHFVGSQDRPLDHFALCDLFVLPAREDAFPLACLEAAALGLPLVCFDTGGMPELIEAADGGVVVPYPRVDAMADAVVALLGDEKRRRGLGSRAREAVRTRHDVEVAAPALWADAVGSRR